MTETTREYIVLTAHPNDEVRAQWEEMLRNSSFATHYVTPDFFADPFAGRGKRFAVLALEGDRMNAVMTGTKNGNIVSSGLGVRPQTVFRDGVDMAAAAESLISGLTELSASDTHLIRFFSWQPLEGADLREYEHQRCSGSENIVMLDLSKGPDDLFKAFSERRRTDLRKVMRQTKLDIKLLETEQELAELYEIHKDWNLRKGNTPDAFESFQAILYSEHRAIFVALTEGKIVAGTYLRYCKGAMVEYAANNSLVEYQHLRPNELLGWRAIEWACANGFKKFSMGASHPFLARYGGELVAAHRYQLDRSFLKRHANRERVSRFATETYMSLPERWRKRIKSVAARV